MRKILMAAMFCASGAAMGADVGVSVSVSEPGFYGRVDIGDAPRPRLLYAEPIIIDEVRVVSAPVYLHVPPGHAKDWGKHCRKYNACGQRVYFVEETWYSDVYVPHYKDKKGKHGKGHGKDKHKGKGKD